MRINRGKRGKHDIIRVNMILQIAFRLGSVRSCKL